MTAPDNKNLSDDDYLDADFDSDLPDIDNDLPDDQNNDFDDGEDIFAKPQKKRNNKKILAGLVVATALVAGSGFFFLNGSEPNPQTTSSPQAENVPQAPTAPVVPDLPGIPMPASDFETAENPASLPPATPDAVNAPNNVAPSDIPAVPDSSQVELQQNDTPSVDNQADLTNIDASPEQNPDVVVSGVGENEIPPPLIDILPEVPVSADANEDASSAVKNEPINLDTVGETSIEPATSNQTSGQEKKAEKDDFQRIVDRAQTVKPEPKKNNAQTEYFDSPKGEAVRELPPPAINPFTEPGQNLIIVNRTPTAGAVLEKGDNSDYVESRLVFAKRASALGKNEAALDFYNDIYRQNSRDPRIVMGRAVTYQKLGETQKAIDAYYEVLDIQPDSPEALTNLMGLLAKTKPAVALENLLNLREQFPRNPSVAAQLGVAYAQSGNPQDGLRYLQMAADLEPRNPQHYFNIAVIAEHMGNRDIAISNYEKTLDTSAVHGAGQSSTFSREQIYDRLSRLRGG